MKNRHHTIPPTGLRTNLTKRLTDDSAWVQIGFDLEVDQPVVGFNADVDEVLFSANVVVAKLRLKLGQLRI